MGSTSIESETRGRASQSGAILPTAGRVIFEGSGNRWLGPGTCHRQGAVGAPPFPVYARCFVAHSISILASDLESNRNQRQHNFGKQ